jgi:hypothetical protein
MSKPSHYLPALLEHVKLRPREVRIVTVYHDPDCPKLTGGECRCAPDLELSNRPERRAKHRKEARGSAEKGGGT